MQDSNRLPRKLIILEVIGVLFILLALLLLNSGTDTRPGDANHLLAKISVYCGVILILPAVGLLIWRSLRTMFPSLFGRK